MKTANGANIPTEASAHLSDVDDKSDVDVKKVVDQLQKTVISEPAYNNGKNLFNIMLDEDEIEAACDNVAVDVEAYKESMLCKKQSWVSFAETVLKPDTVGTKTAVSCTPSKEQQAYLDQGPNLQNFIRASGSFMNDSSEFLLQFEQMQDLKEDLKDTCQLYVNKMQRNAIAENLAKCHLKEN